MLMKINRIVSFMNKQNYSWLAIGLNSTIAWKQPMTGKSQKFKTYKQLLINNMSLDSDQATSLLNKNTNIFEIPIEKIIKNCLVCRYHNVDFQNAERTDCRFLELSEDELENKIIILEEMGAKFIDTLMLTGLLQNVNMMAFKSYSKIPRNEDVARNLYSHLHQPPPEVTPLKKLSENMEVIEFRSQCLHHYLQWRLAIPASNVELLKKIRKKLIKRNFTSLKQCFDILHYNIGLSIDTIRNHNYMENCSPIDMKKILENIDSVCGIPIIKLYRSAPTLFQIKYDDLLAAKKILEHYQFSQIQLENCYEVLLLEKKSLESGLKIIIETPELRILMNHPKILQILLMKNKIRQRMAYLNYLKVKDITVSALIKSNHTFEREIIRRSLMKVTEVNNKLDPSDRYSASQMLALCEYEIERNYHFSGDGVWQKNDKKLRKAQELTRFEINEWKKFKCNDTINNVNSFQFIDTKKIKS
ncbi:transcription termination factor 5, mitochondrial isoform X2 [Microplitis mediator]|uniref:transcription termination factor 5, mitochondrial isoform X2 n=1 Tax=Microplitis mediator TaxID=375433 RepID=UPI0025551776|nr:transcription termination factor 5, mitochondrial isoform X2 [Microplitis mediator]